MWPHSHAVYGASSTSVIRAQRPLAAQSNLTLINGVFDVVGERRDWFMIVKGSRIVGAVHKPPPAVFTNFVSNCCLPDRH